MKKLKSDIDFYVIKKVREFRIENNLTQSELAHQLNLTSGFIGKVESPKSTSKYNLNHLNLLSKIFNCSPKDFLPEETI